MLKKLNRKIIIYIYLNFHVTGVFKKSKEPTIKIHIKCDIKGNDYQNQ